MEDWPSGRRRMFGVHVYGQPYLGFESLIFRSSETEISFRFFLFFWEKQNTNDFPAKFQSREAFTDFLLYKRKITSYFLLICLAVLLFLELELNFPIQRSENFYTPQTNGKKPRDCWVACEVADHQEISRTWFWSKGFLRTYGRSSDQRHGNWYWKWLQTWLCCFPWQEKGTFRTQKTLWICRENLDRNRWGSRVRSDWMAYC